ncbi:hypothetical protein SEPCBS119000_000429 [Sporothrix epigloea]|uniref:Uncharacterized protein n=1 Tax=Sporothrix epigloea TaxID=1892477 RepID=A0ABP0D8W3_9PEZI
MTRLAARIPDDEAIRGREAWKNFREVQHAEGETLLCFLVRIEKLAVEFLDACNPGKQGHFDLLLIWHVLDLLDATVPGWEDRFQKGLFDKQNLSSETWQTKRSWNGFIALLQVLAPPITLSRKTVARPERVQALFENVSLSDQQAAAALTKSMTELSIKSRGPADKSSTAIKQQTPTTIAKSRADEREDHPAKNSSLPVTAGKMTVSGVNSGRDDANTPDEKVAVIIDGELRYAIPGYESRKKPRHDLASAPRFIIEKFFRLKFPGRPKCGDCNCRHPEIGYMLCSLCRFCHMGGDIECYVQHPQLRGTRPAKDKYRMDYPASEGESDSGESLEADESVVAPRVESKSSNSIPKQAESKQQSGAGAEPKPASMPNDEAARNSVANLATSMETLTVIETRSPARAADDDMSNLASSLKTLGFVDPSSSTPSKSPPLVFDSPTSPFLAFQSGVAHLSQKAKCEVEESPTDTALSSTLPQAAVSSLTGTHAVHSPVSATVTTNPVLQSTPAASSAPADVSLATAGPERKATTHNGGGVKLTEDNLSRVPHGRDYPRWATMSSLSTSSSGASLVAFQTRRRAELEKAIEKRTENQTGTAATAEADPRQSVRAEEGTSAQAEQNHRGNPSGEPEAPKRRGTRGGRKKGKQSKEREREHNGQIV